MKSFGNVSVGTTKRDMVTESLVRFYRDVVIHLL